MRLRHPVFSALGFSLLPISLLLGACGGDVTVSTNPGQETLLIDFNQGISDWKSGFADYPAGEENFYELNAGHANLPSELGANRKGFRVSGNNHSDDLFMFIAKRVTGLEPNTRYDFQFEISFGSNAKKGCMGVGGAPGEAVTIKAGASKFEPKAVNNGNDWYLMNIDKGNQSIGGSDALVLGHFANSRDCEVNDDSYLKKTLRNNQGSFTTYSAADGSVWIFFGTDSGYESTTTIYYLNGKVWASKR